MIVQADVPIAVVEWPGDDPPVLYAHATGFHKCVWRKVASLVGRHAFALDLRGHGDSGKPPTGYHWSHFAEEILAVVDALPLAVPLDAVGHSSGAASLILAEAARPGSLRRLVGFEPIVFPTPEGGGIPLNPMAEGARRRRMLFPSLDAAKENYLSKPPMSNWDPEVMDDYVGDGLFQRDDGQWELKCPGVIEAQVYENSHTHGAWDRLGEVAAPTLIVRGATGAGAGPVMVSEEQARRLPHGSLAEIEGAGHFSPMERPEEAARVIRDFLAGPQPQ